MAIEVDNTASKYFATPSSTGPRNLAWACSFCCGRAWLPEPLNRGVDATWFAVVFGAVALFALLTHYGARLIRSRITYPRTG